MFRTIMILLSVLAALACAADWPMFKGNPERTGFSPADSLRPPLALNTLYRLTAPILASPSVVNDLVYIQDQSGNVVCVNGPANRLVWKINIGGARNTSSPCVWKGRVFVGSSSGGLHILDAATGARLDTVYPGKPVLTSPAFTRRGVYFSTEDGILARVDSAGRVRMSWPNGKRSFFDFAVRDSSIVFPGYDYVGLIDRETYADSIWAITEQLNLGAIIDDSNYFYTAYANAENVYAFKYHLSTGVKVNMLGTGGAIRYTGIEGSYYSMQPASNLPSYDGIKTYWGNFYSFRKTQGWQTAGWGVSNGIHEGFASSAALCANYVVIGSLAGKLYLHSRASTVSGVPGMAFMFPILDTSDRGHGAIISSPAVSNGRVYFGALDGYLYGLGNGPAINPGTRVTAPRMTPVPSLTLYPNPVALTGFTAVLTGAPASAPTALRAGLYDSRGQRVSALAAQGRTESFLRIQWNGFDDSGRRVAVGKYFLHIDCGVGKEVFPILVVR